MSTRPALRFPQELRDWLEPFLPPPPQSVTKTTEAEIDKIPFVTLTYAQSLDSQLALAPGVRTALSGQETKAMTHYLRSRHDAILVGVGTAIADNPALNCRLDDAVGDLSVQPRPIILDARAQWDVGGSECLHLATLRHAKAPYIFTLRDAIVLPRIYGEDTIQRLESCGGMIVCLKPTVENRGRFAWDEVLQHLAALNIESVMIEGGGSVINSLLATKKDTDLIDSVIVTIAPTWLGQGGVLVNPPRGAEGLPSTRLVDTQWKQFGKDVVLCGRIVK